MTYDDLVTSAARVVDAYRSRNLRLATAESCTGGLVAAIVTEVAGASDVLDRGFVTYSNSAKTTLLGVPACLIRDLGAVSAEVARAMAAGALERSDADVAIAVTGIAGPGGGSPEKPIGLVHVAMSRKAAATVHREFRFGNPGRRAIRLATVGEALMLLASVGELAPD